MKPKDIPLFRKYLSKATHYFEFGCGGSTYWASLVPQIQSVQVVESDFEWIEKCKQKIPDQSKITFYPIQLNTEPNQWGYPGPRATPPMKRRYSRILELLLPEEREKIDTVLIDGRFRVACALHCYKWLKEDVTILFDDFLYRPQYHKILAYFEVVEKTPENSMAVLKKKKGMVMDESLLQQYELIAD